MCHNELPSLPHLSLSWAINRLPEGLYTSLWLPGALYNKLYGPYLKFFASSPSGLVRIFFPEIRVYHHVSQNQDSWASHAHLSINVFAYHSHMPIIFRSPNLAELPCQQ